jgi:pyruvate kinase
MVCASGSLLAEILLLSVREIGILQDLGGSKIRLGKLPGEERELQPDERVILSPMTGLDRSVIPVNYPYIVEDVAVGDRILLADGLVELKVEHKQADRIVCRVVVGGVVQSHKGVNLPTTNIRIPAFTDKDRDDLALGLEEGVDFVTLSFVSHERDLEPVQDVLNQNTNRPFLIAKIEKPRAIERLEKILAQARKCSDPW